MILVQAKKVAELETYGWVLDNVEEDTKKLVNGLPLTMRNLRRDTATVYPDGTVRAVEYHPTLARQEDYNYAGNFKMKVERDALDHLGDICHKISRIFNPESDLSVPGPIDNLRLNFKKLVGVFSK